MSARLFFALTVLAAASAGCAGLGQSQRDLRTAVDAENSTLSSCYGAALQRDPSAAGTVEARLVVPKTSGKVESVNIDRSDLADPTFQSCFTDALQSIQLSQPPGVNLDVAYTFEFTPG